MKLQKAALFTPIDPAGLKLWLKSDAGLFQDSAGNTPVANDGDPVGLWQDQSGQGNHASQSDDAMRPGYKTNVRGGLPSVQNQTLNGNCWLSLPNFLTGFTSGTAVIVWQSSAVSSSQYGAWNIGSFVNGSHWPYSDGKLYDAPFTTTRPMIAAGITANSFYLLIARHNGTTLNVRVNGVETYNAAAPFGVTSTPYLFRQSPLNKCFHGHILECAVYDNDLSNEDVLALEDYVKGRYTKTVTVPNGGNIAAAIATMQSGDALELAAGGTYTVPIGTNGFDTLAAGTSWRHTTVNGNGATVTQAGSGIPLRLGSSKKFIDFNDVNLRATSAAASYVCFLPGATDLIFSDCSFAADGGVFYDVWRTEHGQRITLNRCTVSCTGGRDNSDGFEMWGACKDIVFNECEVMGLSGGSTQSQHGFEVYAAQVGEIANNVQFNGCTARNCDVGFSNEGGNNGQANLSVICDGCTSYDNTLFDYQGVQGSTLIIRNNNLGINGSAVIES